MHTVEVSGLQCQRSVKYVFGVLWKNVTGVWNDTTVSNIYIYPLKLLANYTLMCKFKKEHHLKYTLTIKILFFLECILQTASYW